MDSKAPWDSCSDLEHPSNLYWGFNANRTKWKVIFFPFQNNNQSQNPRPSALLKVQWNSFWSLDKNRDIWQAILSLSQHASLYLLPTHISSPPPYSSIQKHYTHWLLLGNHLFEATSKRSPHKSHPSVSVLSSTCWLDLVLFVRTYLSDTSFTFSPIYNKGNKEEMVLLVSFLKN